MFEIYTKDGCNFCKLAKNLFTIKRLPFKEYILGIHLDKGALLEKFPNARELPIIYDDDVRVGGYRELVGYLQEKDKENEHERSQQVSQNAH